MLKLLDIGGNPNVGVYCRATERFVLIPDSATKREGQEIQEALAVPGTALTVGGSSVVGSLIAANSSGAVVADIILNIELRRIEAHKVKVARLAELLNAAGNNILCNDRGALVNPEYSDQALATIRSALGVEPVRGTLAGLGTVGMGGVATNRGVLVHPKSSKDEQEIARRTLGADVMLGTVNHGTGLIGAGLVANTKGAVIGKASTGVEIARIEDALGFLQAPTSR